MKLHAVQARCRAQPGASEDYPFDLDTKVFRVMGKIFAMTNEAAPRDCVTLKCEPELALALRDRYTGVEPGYHTNKRHWNTVYLDADVPPDEIEEMIDHAYQRVVQGLSKTAQAELAHRPSV